MSDYKKDRAYESISEAVSDAIYAGLSAKDFRRMAADAWEEHCHLSARMAVADLTKEPR